MINKMDISTEKLVSLFSLFFLGTISIILGLFLYNFNFAHKQIIITSLGITFILSYQFVAISLLVYYFSKAGLRIANDFLKDREKYFRLLVFIIGATYLLIIWLVYKDIKTLLQNLIVILIAIISVPQINKWLMKKWNNIGNKKEKVKK